MVSTAILETQGQMSRLSRVRRVVAVVALASLREASQDDSCWLAGKQFQGSARRARLIARRLIDAHANEDGGGVRDEVKGVGHRENRCAVENDTVVDVGHFSQQIGKALRR